jgi:hypothetical protein
MPPPFRRVEGKAKAKIYNQPSNDPKSSFLCDCTMHLMEAGDLGVGGGGLTVYTEMELMKIQFR